MHKQHSIIQSCHSGTSETQSPWGNNLVVKTDSKIVTGQIEKDCSVRDPVLLQYLSVVRSMEKQFKGFTLHHIERSKNEEADMIAKSAAKGDSIHSGVLFHMIDTPAMRNPEGLQITDDPKGQRIVNLIMTKDWRAPITLYLEGHYHAPPPRPGRGQEVEALKS
jgi:hypothetical protein